MSEQWFSSERMYTGLRMLWGETEAQDPDAPPVEIVDWLTRLRLLHGVPFAYLVPDPDLMPPESIRFFWLDRDWTDAAVEGAMSAAGAHSMVRTVAVTEDAKTRALLDVRERNISPHVDLGGGEKRLPGGGPVRPEEGRIGPVAFDPLDGEAGVVTGFLLRSRAVSGWPGIHVRAIRDGEELRLFRIERLAPAVLLALIDGSPDEVHVEEPKRGLQFGLDPVPGAGGSILSNSNPEGRRRVILRDPDDGEEILDEDGDKANQVVPFRPDAPGIVEVAALASRIAGNEHSADFRGDDDIEPWPDGISSAELTTQLIQYPYRQLFRGDGEDPDGGISGVVLHVTTPLVILDDLAFVEDLD